MSAPARIAELTINPFIAGFNALEEVRTNSPKSPHSPKEINENIVQLMNACLAHYSEMPHLAKPITYVPTKGSKCQVTYSSPTHIVMSVDVIKQGKDAAEKAQEKDKGVLIVVDKSLTIFIIRPERLRTLKVLDWVNTVNPMTSEGMVNDFAYPQKYSKLEVALTLQSTDLFLQSLKTASDRKAKKCTEFREIIGTVITSMDTVGIVVKYVFEDTINPQNKS